MKSGLTGLVLAFLIHVGATQNNRTECLQVYRETNCVQEFNALVSGGRNIEEQTDHLCGDSCKVHLNDYRTCLGLSEEQKRLDDNLFCGRYNGVYCTVLSREDPVGTAALAAVGTKCSTENNCSEQCSAAINHVNEVHGCCANAYSGIGGIPFQPRFERYYTNCNIGAPPLDPCSGSVSINGAISLLVTVFTIVALN